jgi:methionyl-tRNA formyltransferase
MGTPGFAVPSLMRLINSENTVSAVFTQTPKPKGRGMREEKSPVHLTAERHSIQVYTPQSLRNEETIELIRSIEADVIVVVAYGFIIPKVILDMKKYGCLNIHPSMLPKYRGAAPLQMTIINDDKETAVCIIQMNEGLDTGDIIIQKRLSLAPRTTLMDLHDKCAEIGAEILIEALSNIDHLPRIKQTEAEASYASKFTKEEGRIDWEEDAYRIDCKIRGMNPWPGTYFEYDEKYYKILEAENQELEHNFIPGTVINDKMHIACGNGVLKINKIQQAGKKALEINEFLKGVSIPVGSSLNSRGNNE